MCSPIKYLEPSESIGFGWLKEWIALCRTALKISVFVLVQVFLAWLFFTLGFKCCDEAWKSADPVERMEMRGVISDQQ